MCWDLGLMFRFMHVQCAFGCCAEELGNHASSISILLSEEGAVVLCVEIPGA